MDMNTGFLWFNNDPKMTLLQKVQAAVADFQKKFGRDPEYCLVNVSDTQDSNLEEIAKICKIIVQSYKFVLPHNFWVGYEEMAVRDEAA